jgi:hypothetical protein
MTDRQPLMTGGCQCGAVRYALFSVPASPSVCHCRMCQKAMGGPFLASASVAGQHFAWTRGAPKTFASSSKGLRDFCADCGTPLAVRTPGSDDVDITIATLDDPHRLKPVRQIGTESLLPWVHELKSLPAKTTEENTGADFLQDLVSYQLTSGEPTTR